jgi:hypothetical protein
MTSSEIWAIVSSIVSLAFSVLAIWLTLYLYIRAKDTERSTATTLTKIEGQTDALQRIIGRQLDRLTKSLTNRPEARPEEVIFQLIPVLRQLQGSLLAEAHEEEKHSTTQSREIALAYAALYFYVSQANFWGQLSLPAADDFDQTNRTQVEAKALVDLSAQDFQIVARVLESLDLSMIKGTGAEVLFLRTRDFWRTMVRTSADVFVLRSKAKQDEHPK